MQLSQEQTLWKGRKKMTSREKRELEKKCHFTLPKTYLVFKITWKNLIIYEERGELTCQWSKAVSSQFFFVQRCRSSCLRWGMTVKYIPTKSLKSSQGTAKYSLKQSSLMIKDIYKEWQKKNMRNAERIGKIINAEKKNKEWDQTE